MRLVPNPYLHFEATHVYNPLRDLTLAADDARFALLQSLRGADTHLNGDEAIRSLASDEWLVEEGRDLASQFHLKIVSLETNTVCNQACYFCPVSIDPRDASTMSDELFESILEQLQEFRSTLQGIFLQSYNEPTVDKRFVEHCRRIKAADLPVAVLSNGSGMTAQKVDEIVSFGPLRYLCINLSTLDRHRYKEERGADHLPVVLKNLDYLKDKPFAEQMKMVVLGTGDAKHDRDFAEISERFAGSRFNIERHVVMDRAGYLEVGLQMQIEGNRLRGCDNLGSRPIQHLHITPRGACVLCCEDYDENYVVGELSKQTVREVLTGPELSNFRRWAYGVENAPEEFICRKCVFARSE